MLVVNERIQLKIFCGHQTKITLDIKNERYDVNKFIDQLKSQQKYLIKFTFQTKNKQIKQYIIPFRKVICFNKSEFQESGPIPMKLVVVGDGAVGKTCVLHRYMNNTFTDDYVPTVFENSSIVVKIQNKSVQLGVWDTAGQEEYNRLRPLSYNNTDIFLIIFSVVDPESFDNALKKWYPELQQISPKSLKVFVGNKSDLLTHDQYKNKTGKNAPVNSQSVKTIVNELDCQYFECSAKEDTGIKELFMKAVSDGLAIKQKQNQIRQREQKISCNLI